MPTIFFCQHLLTLDASGNPVTEQVQSVVVTDPSGNPVTGKKESVEYIYSFMKYTICERFDTAEINLKK